MCQTPTPRTESRRVCSPGQVFSGLERHPCSPRVCRFDSQSGHTPTLQVPSPVGTYRKRPMDVYLTLMSLSLSLPLSIKAMRKCPQVRIKIRKEMRALSSAACLWLFVMRNKHRIGQLRPSPSRTFIALWVFFWHLSQSHLLFKTSLCHGQRGSVV